LSVSLLDKDVGWLEIPMNHRSWETMSLCERLADLTRDPNDTINRENPVLAKHLAKRRAIDVLHDEVELAVFPLTGIVHRYRVRAAELSSNADFAEKTLGKSRVG
jgi:hypothetical protein